MRRRPLPLILLLAVAIPLSARWARADLGNPTPVQQRAYDFERSLFEKPPPSNDLRPLPEASQRPLFEAFVKTLKTPEEKVAFLELAAYRYVFSINPNVFVDYAVPMLKDEDAGVRLAAIKGITFFRMICDLPLVKGDGMRIDAHADAVAPLMASEKDASIRGAAITCVGALHGAKYLDDLVAALDKDPADEARAGAAVGLLWMAAGKSVPRDARRVALSVVVSHLRPDEKEKVLHAMMLAPPGLADLDTRSFADGVAALLPNERFQEEAIRTLRGLASSAHAAEVAALVSDPRVGGDAAEALAVIATREQMPTLLKMLESGDAYTQDHALNALDRLDARDQRPAVERVSQADLRANRNGTAATTLLHKWDTRLKP